MPSYPTKVWDGSQWVYTAAQPTDLTNYATKASPIFTGNVGIGTSNIESGANVTLGRIDSSLEGGQVTFNRSTDDTPYWNIDVYGSTSSPSLRVHNSGTVKMQIDSSGRLSVPYQPSFYAIKTTSTAANTTITGHDIVQVNVGSCFNASTGRFTAPIAGVYLIIHSQLGNNTAIDIYLQKNGVSVAGWWNRPSNVGGDYDLSERTVICSLAANDYVSVLGNKTLYSDINGWTTFAGYLLG